MQDLPNQPAGPDLVTLDSEVVRLPRLFQDSLEVTWTAPGKVATGADDMYVLNLVVSDGASGEKAEHTLRVTVGQIPPVADAGNDMQYDFQDTLHINLNGLESNDPDGDRLSYRWEQVGGPGVIDETRKRLANPLFSAVAPADYIFVLKVTDDGIAAEGAVASDPDTVRIRVTDRGGRGP